MQLITLLFLVLVIDKKNSQRPQWTVKELSRNFPTIIIITWFVGPSYHAMFITIKIIYCCFDSNRRHGRISKIALPPFSRVSWRLFFVLFPLISSTWLLKYCYLLFRNTSFYFNIYKTTELIGGWGSSLVVLIHCSCQPLSINSFCV